MVYFGIGSHGVHGANGHKLCFQCFCATYHEIKIFQSIQISRGHSISRGPPIIMDGSRDTRPTVLVPEVLCKKSVILKQFKSLGGPQGGGGGKGVPEPPLPQGVSWMV